MKDMSPLEELRHSCSHVLATAVLRLFPETQLDIGPPTDNGFYYDIDLDKKLDATDLEAIEAEMNIVIKENQRFERIECSREEAIAKIQAIGQERYKLGRLNDIAEGEQVSFYQNGEFLDLCAGPHVNYTKKIKVFKEHEKLFETYQTEDLMGLGDIDIEEIQSSELQATPGFFDRLFNIFR